MQAIKQIYAKRHILPYLIIGILPATAYFPWIGGEYDRTSKAIVCMFIVLCSVLPLVIQRLGIMFGLLLGYSWALFFTYGMEKWGIYDVLCISAAVGCTYLWAGLKEDKKELLIKITIYTGAFQAVYGMIQACNFDPVFKIWDIYQMGRPHGLMGHPTVLGPYLVACACMAWFKGYQKSFAAMMVAILWTQSLMTYASLGVFLSVVLLLNLYNAAIVLMVPIVVAFGWLGFALFHGTDFLSMSGRLQVWEHTLEVMSHGTLWNIFGYGPGSWMALSPSFVENITRVWGQTHNDPIQNGFEYGYFGILMMACALFMIVKITVSPKWRLNAMWLAVFWSLFTNSCGNFVLRLIPTGLFFLIAFYELTEGQNVKVAEYEN